ncbi:hypothetical protein ANN_03947 [Periplaneta americana]|uniref:Uncharacterized protein n=1 Tax=Periplaneta americana TaxID=6978 RepID=A0ABQ8T795_PERAM|nr:hypothetical protein ANN_03947 [Periplaneta americana]
MHILSRLKLDSNVLQYKQEDFFDVDRVQREQKVEVSSEKDEVLTESIVNHGEKRMIQERTGIDCEEDNLTQCGRNRPNCSNISDVSRNSINEEFSCTYRLIAAAYWGIAASTIEVMFAVHKLQTMSSSTGHIFQEQCIDVGDAMPQDPSRVGMKLATWSPNYLCIHFSHASATYPEVLGSTCKKPYLEGWVRRAGNRVWKPRVGCVVNYIWKSWVQSAVNCMWKAWVRRTVNLSEVKTDIKNDVAMQICSVSVHVDGIVTIVKDELKADFDKLKENFATVKTVVAELRVYVGHFDGKIRTLERRQEQTSEFLDKHAEENNQILALIDQHAEEI